ncbi:Hypothetical protein R9X50_00196400 [Acrodontium crateriforme]|uniref:JmjC domain-containing protein n=1 Tax=Acrodontium crateriforme TaxID=150365 RepID=A0AAQ3M0D1_9PEZI|nr:Hypothetical protein R9X50_00196400 [Acrodontium crateriforme]
MLAARLPYAAQRCSFSTAAHVQRQVPILSSPDIDTFRDQAFVPALPFLLPRHTFRDLPAIRNWFLHQPTNTSNGPLSPALNLSYLARFGSTIVPLEITNNDHFVRTSQALSFFLACVNASSSSYEQAISPPKRINRYFSARRPGSRPIRRSVVTKRATGDFFSSSSAISTPTARVYLAQATLSDLPQALRDDLSPTPSYVLEAGKGDVYDTSIWLGEAPTYTPLHRDPNPNLFVQLAGRKSVRLVRPDVGMGIFAKVQERIGGNASATMRGEEMMAGPEKLALEEEVWGDDSEFKASMWEAEVGVGDGLFIPKGWWHSIKGTGEGMTGSVNWWFR